MTGLARYGTMDRGCGCGIKQHQGREAAETALGKAVRLALPGTEPERLRIRECRRRPGVWHVYEIGGSRDEAFSPAVAALIDARDLWCVLDGSTVRLQRHHRRIRGIGGDPRPHTDCACVGVRLCARCHARIHDTEEGRLLAEAEGLIIPRVTAFPGSLSVLVHLEADSGGMRKWPSCDGKWLDQQPGSRAVA